MKTITTRVVISIRDAADTVIKATELDLSLHVCPPPSSPVIQAESVSSNLPFFSHVSHFVGSLSHTLQLSTWHSLEEEREREREREYYIHKYNI